MALSDTSVAYANLCLLSAWLTSAVSQTLSAISPVLLTLSTISAPDVMKREHFCVLGVISQDQDSENLDLPPPPIPPVVLPAPLVLSSSIRCFASPTLLIAVTKLVFFPLSRPNQPIWRMVSLVTRQARSVYDRPPPTSLRSHSVHHYHLWKCFYFVTKSVWISDPRCRCSGGVLVLKCRFKG